MHRSGLVLLSIVGSVALAIGCSGGDDGGTGGQSTGDQASDDVDDEVEIPDFQIEPAPGARRANLVDEGQLQLDYAEADFDRVVAFYDDWTAEDDGTWVWWHLEEADLHRNEAPLPVPEEEAADGAP